MIPILYPADETTFASNGIGRLSECTRCIVTEERNGIYECEFDLPTTAKHFEDVIEGRIISVTHDNKGDRQPFDIYSRSAPINGIVTFYAHHVSYRLGNAILEPFTASSVATALSLIPSHIYDDCDVTPFTYWTDVVKSGMLNVTEPVSVKAILGGTSGSILDSFGTAEYEWDKFAVKLHANRGTSSGVVVRYGHNLTDLVYSLDYSSTYNAVAPYWKGTEEGSETETIVTLTEGIVTRTNIGSDPVKAVPMDCSSEFDTPPTEEQLRNRARTILNNRRSWLPNENLKISFAQLWQYEQYNGTAPVQRLSLCDKVDVVHSELGLTATDIEIVKVVYDVLMERYDSMELGEVSTSFAQVVTANIQDEIAAVKASAVTQSMLHGAVTSATQQITGANGGYVVLHQNASTGEPYELLIMNTNDITTAQKVWRWNSAGLGYSSTGYNGTYGLAITADGAIVADYITTGTLSANRISGGTLSALQGKSYWNLETGTFYSVGTETSTSGTNYTSTFTLSAGKLSMQLKKAGSSTVNAKLDIALGIDTNSDEYVAIDAGSGTHLYVRSKDSDYASYFYMEPRKLDIIAGHGNYGAMTLSGKTIEAEATGGKMNLTTSANMTLRANANMTLTADSIILNPSTALKLNSQTGHTCYVMVGGYRLNFTHGVLTSVDT